ncbi:MAG: PBP1A family penicillin-binding protein, partial [Oscillospiraceae bacterium]|nr:PBP1A family penicillin-binding protein [Oscillospiraceae bacterium]
DENRIIVSYDQIPKHLRDAAVAIEDKRFYSHQGVDWYRTVAAVFNMFLSMDDTFGGSTITQQLIKNTTGEDQVTVKRKLVEIFQALELEKKYTKKQILESYLNTIYFGQKCYGVQTAANMYYGKDVSELSLAESAALIGITNNPSLYDPYISDASRERNKSRQEDILYEMLKQGKITQAEYDEAVDEELVFTRGNASDTTKKNTAYSWFVDEVIRDVTEDLMEKYDLNEQGARTMLYTGGYSIYATIDMDIQNIVDEVYENTENMPYADSDLGQTLQSAIVVTDPYTGHVVAMAGGIGEKTESLNWNRATMSKRSPGSSIKPLTVYGPALELGYITPYSVLDDSPLYFDYAGGKNGFYPKNDFGYVYSGACTIMYAVQRSLNTVAAKVVDGISPEQAFRFGYENFGLETLIAERFSDDGRTKWSDVDIAPMALGALTDGVSVKDMAAAYGAFANQGYFNEPITYTHMTTDDGEIILENEITPSYAVSEVTAYYMNNLLTNAVSIGTGTPGRFSGMTIAGKTGTSDSNTDRWFCGYTPYYSAAVWVGFDIPEEVVVSGNNPAVLMWKYVMERVHEDLEYAKFTTPDDIVSSNYCMDCGNVPNEYCELDVRGTRVATGLFHVSDVPRQVCTCHVPVDICDESEHVAGTTCINTHPAALLSIDRSHYPEILELTDDEFLVENYPQCEIVHADGGLVDLNGNGVPDIFEGYVPGDDDTGTTPGESGNNHNAGNPGGTGGGGGGLSGFLNGLFGN